jgi:hypothetical protein
VADETAVQSAFRDDLLTVMTLPEHAHKPKLVLQMINYPSYLFDFTALVELFARQIIPSQVAKQRSDLAVFFSPLRVSIFGLA